MHVPDSATTVSDACTEQKWPTLSRQLGQFGTNAWFNQPLIAVEGSEEIKLLREMTALW